MRPEEGRQATPERGDFDPRPREVREEKILLTLLREETHQILRAI